MSRRSVVVLLGASCLFLAGGKKASKVSEASVVPPPVQGLFLRGGFDKDPSGYLGRFLPPDTSDVDESNGMQLTCSQHISYKEVDAGGVQYDEVFNASSQVAARIGIPGLVSLGGGKNESTSVRVRYVLTKKMVSDVPDPAALERCCKAAPDQCTDRFIGEFYEGTGEVFYAYNSGHGGGGKGRKGPVGVELDYRNGVAWAKSVTFPNPIYFAFKTAPNLWTGAQDGGCGDWVDAPPKSTQGTYFVGLSDPRGTEAAAREAALADARAQTVRWAGTAIAEGTLSLAVTGGERTQLIDALSEEKRMSTASSGIARLVKDESWCITAEDTPEGKLYVAKVLAFLAKESEEPAARAVLDAVK